MVFAVQTARNVYKESCLEIYKMVDLFGNKKRINKLRADVVDSFNHVKKDFNKVGKWIKHLDDKHTLNENEIPYIKDQLLTINKDLAEIKDFISFFSHQLPGGMSKQTATMGVKQTVPSDVQTGVQTGVQTDILNNFTVMERAIVWALLNSEMKLSYEDIAALLGKKRSTIRGQINAIKQKNEGIIMESRELNGKKRLYIPDEIKANIMKSVKVKVKAAKNSKNS